MESTCHLIPSGTTLIGDVFQIMAHDPIFENPEEFRPERYLSENGKTMRKDLVDRTLPFSMGKRQCVGEGKILLKFISLLVEVSGIHLAQIINSPEKLSCCFQINHSRSRSSGAIPLYRCYPPTLSHSSIFR